MDLTISIKNQNLTKICLKLISNNLMNLVIWLHSVGDMRLATWCCGVEDLAICKLELVKWMWTLQFGKMDLMKRHNQLGDLTKQMAFRTFVQMLDNSIMQWQTILKDQYNYNLTLKLMTRVVGQGFINGHC